MTALAVLVSISYFGEEERGLQTVVARAPVRLYLTAPPPPPFHALHNPSLQHRLHHDSTSVFRCLRSAHSYARDFIYIRTIHASLGSYSGSEHSRSLRARLLLNALVCPSRAYLGSPENAMTGTGPEALPTASATPPVLGPAGVTNFSLKVVELEEAVCADLTDSSLSRPLRLGGLAGVAGTSAGLPVSLSSSAEVVLAVPSVISRMSLSM